VCFDPWCPWNKSQSRLEDFPIYLQNLYRINGPGLLIHLVTFSPLQHYQLHLMMSILSHPCLPIILLFTPQYIFDCLEAGELLDAASSKYLVIFKNGSDKVTSKPQKAVVRKRAPISESLKGSKGKEKEKEGRVSWDTKDVEKSEMRKEKQKGKENRKSLSNLGDDTDDEDRVDDADVDLEGTARPERAQAVSNKDIEKKSSNVNSYSKKSNAKAITTKLLRQKSSSSPLSVPEQVNTKSSEKGEAEFSFSVPGSPVLPVKRRLSNARVIEDSPPLSPSPTEKKTRAMKRSDLRALEPAVVPDKKASKAQRDTASKSVPIREMDFKRKTPIGSQDSIDESVLKHGRVESKPMASSGLSAEDKGRGKTKALVGSDIEERIVNTKTREDSPCW
jgi:hypothetical protein